MSSVSLSYSIEAIPARQYRGWRLTASVTDPVLTDGTHSSPDIFVMKTSKEASGDKEVFSHVATLWEMRNLPATKSDVPPKSNGFYRSSVLKLDFMSREAVDSAIPMLEADVNLLIYAASSPETVDSATITVPAPAE